MKRFWEDKIRTYDDIYFFSSLSLSLYQCFTFSITVLLLLFIDVKFYGMLYKWFGSEDDR